MPFADFSQSDKSPNQFPSSRVAQSSHFQWIAALDAAPLSAGWQDHLTRYVVASATVSVASGRREPVQLDDVTVVNDPLNLYQITHHEQEVAVRVAYAHLSQAFMDVLYDCHLLLKTSAGGRFVTIPAPKPPSRTEWKQVLKALWFQLLRAEDTVLVVTDVPGLPPEDLPLSTFTGVPALDWEEADASPLGGTVSEWQRELRFVLDLAHPGMLRGRVDWKDWRDVTNPPLDMLPLTSLGPVLSRADQRKKDRFSWLGGKKVFSLPSRIGSLSWNMRWREVSRMRVAALVAGGILLCLIGVMIVGAPRGNATEEQPMTAVGSPSPLSPVPSDTPSSLTPAPAPPPQPTPPSSNQPAPTPPAANAPPTSPAPVLSPQPPPPSSNQPAPTPAPSVPTPGPTPTPPPAPTNTPAPAPTEVPTPGPTSTPPPVPTDTPTPAPTETPAPAPTVTPSSTPTSETSPAPAPTLSPPATPPLAPTPSPGINSSVGNLWRLRINKQPLSILAIPARLSPIAC